MTLSAGANITGHNQSSAADNTISTLQAGKSQGKYLKQRILIVHTNYWYRTTLIYHVYSTHKQRISDLST